MIKIINPHSHHSHSSTTVLKTAEILSKYRPIAPKPGTSRVNDDHHDPSSSMSRKISQSPYLRNLWPQLQARPTRTRKRGRIGPSSPLSMKRPKSSCVSPNSTTSTQHVLGPVKTLSFQAFSTRGLPNMTQVGYALENCVSNSPALVTLPLLQCSPPSFKCMGPEIKGKGVIDLNKTVEVIQERDFLKQLQGPITTTTSKVIAPKPIRPVSSRINVAYINPPTNTSPPYQTSKKTPQEIEEDVESDALPRLISDSNNRVRLVNSAYKEMMGQPECSWLDSIVRGRRICGEVMIHFSESSRIPENDGFSCWARIEWGRDGKEECVHAFCDVMKVACESMDYVFTWRFHTTTETCQPSCNA